MTEKTSTQMTDNLKFMSSIIKDILTSTINKKRFTGHIIFDINCTDGGITSNNGEIKQIIKK